jgi:hypothetical protein
MDTGRWNHGDMFPVLDLMAQFEFKSPGSLSFQLGKSVSRDSSRLPEMDPGEELPGGGDKWDMLLAAGPVFVVIGWLDVHHPCDGFHPLRLRVGLPDRYVSWESMRDLVPQVVAALRLPADVPYRAHLTGQSEQLLTEEPWSGFVS